MSVIPILAIFLFVFLFSKEKAQVSEPPQPPKTDQELIAELLAKLIERGSQSGKK